jgi:hypothetical protein
MLTEPFLLFNEFATESSSLFAAKALFCVFRASIMLAQGSASFETFHV